MDGGKSKYGRDRLPFNITCDQSAPLLFQVVDLDYVQGLFTRFSLFILMLCSADNGVHIRLFGTTRKGNSVCCLASTYVPYFYVKAPTAYKNKSQLVYYESALNAKLLVGLFQCSAL